MSHSSAAHAYAPAAHRPGREKAKITRRSHAARYRAARSEVESGVRYGRSSTSGRLEPASDRTSADNRADDLALLPFPSATDWR
jgi:hypothetical protein